MSTLTGSEIVARELPRSDWLETLGRGGLSSSYGELVAELFEANNAALIDNESGHEVRRGPTELGDALATVLPEVIVSARPGRELR